jgi:transposase
MNKTCGLDVHKDSIFACILDEQGEKILEKRYGTLTPDLDELHQTLVETGCGRVAMESTSIYRIPVWHVPESDFELKLANPYFIRQLPGRKSDAKDAQWIAECLQKELIRGSFVTDNVLQQMQHSFQQLRIQSGEQRIHAQDNQSDY